MRRGLYRLIKIIIWVIGLALLALNVGFVLHFGFKLW